MRSRFFQHVTTRAQQKLGGILGIINSVRSPLLQSRNLKLLPPKRRLPVQRMAVFRSILVLSPHLDGLIRLAGNQPQAREIEHGAHDAGLSVKRAGLRDTILVLELVARLPVPEGDAAVVAAAEHDVVLVDAQRVDDAVVPVEVLHEGPVWALPLLDLPRAAGGEGPFCWVRR